MTVRDEFLDALDRIEENPPNDQFKRVKNYRYKFHGWRGYTANVLFLIASLFHTYTLGSFSGVWQGIVTFVPVASGAFLIFGYSLMVFIYWSLRSFLRRKKYEEVNSLDVTVFMILGPKGIAYSGKTIDRLLILTPSLAYATVQSDSLIIILNVFVLSLGLFGHFMLRSFARHVANDEDYLKIFVNRY